MKQRMRRISALLLVALMCVSCVVPAFAAESEGCPAIHTKSNCSYKQIGEPHEAACGEQGYTTYQCNECGAYFADDFVPSKGEHAYQYVMQAPTCTEGGFYKKVCLNCGETEVIDSSKDSDYEPTGHDWVAKNADLTAAPGSAEYKGNCEEGVVCSVCGVAAKEIDDEFHDWGEPELLKAPTHNTKNEVVKGSAKFTCEICGETKTVEVYCDKDCVFVADQKKEASCEEEGFWPGATCVICGKKVHFVRADECDYVECTVEGCDHGTTEGCKRVDCENCTHVTFFEHCDGVDCKDANCEHLTCLHAPYEKIEKVDCKVSAEWVVVLPNCTEAGSASKVCTMCQETIGTPVVLDPLGHVYQTKIYKVVETGGMTAEQIAMFDGISRGVAEGETHKCTVFVKNAKGELEAKEFSAVIPAVFGENDTLTPAEPTTPSTPDEDEVYYVWTGEYQNDDPLSEDIKGQHYMHWADSCSSTVAHSYYTYVCIECNHSEPTVSFTGHYWELTDDGDPSCDKEENGFLEYTCANPNCDGKNDADVDDEDAGITYSENADGNAVKTVAIKWGHVFESHTVDATCVSKGYTVDKCKWCGDVDLTKADEGYGAAEDDGDNSGWYDVVAINPDAHDEYDDIIVAADCVKDGLKHVKCRLCNKTLESSVTVKATGHVADKTQKVSTTTASCTAAGYDIYKCANANCDATVQVEHTPIKAHSYTTLEVVGPNCLKQQAGYTIIRCKTCGKESPEQADPTPFDKNNPAHHTSVSVLDVTAGDCTTLDIVVRKCNACDHVWTSHEDFEGGAVGETFGKGEGAGHTIELVEEIKATCVEKGQKAHYKCTVCKKLFADEAATTPITDEKELVIEKLTENGEHPEDKFYYSAKVDATCTKNGHEEGVKCTLCNTWLNPEKTITKYNHTFRAEDHDGKTGTAWELQGSREANCTEWGYNWYKCAICDAEKIEDYVADFGGHKTEKIPGRVPTCCTYGLTDGEYCTVCGDVDHPLVKQEVIDKVAHVNAKGEEFFGICTDTVEDRVCVVCKSGEFKYTDAEGKTQKIKLNCNGDHDHDADIVKYKDAEGNIIVGGTVDTSKIDAEVLKKGAHVWVKTFVPATCMEYSYTLVVCEHCDYSFMEGEGFEYSDDHIAWGDWKIEKPATTIETGLKVRVCACGAKEEVVIPALAGLEIEVDLENGVKPGYDLPDNGVINVVVNTNASDLDVWGIRIELKYDGTAGVEYIGAISKSGKFTDAGVSVNVNQTAKTIIIVATAPNGADGKLADVNLDGREELVTLQFKLKNTVVKGNEFTVTAGSICEVNDKDQNRIAVIPAENSSIEVTATSGDVIVNGYSNIDDAKALMLYVTGEAEKEYNSAADMNQDGEVTATDFAIIRNVLLMG